MIPHSIQGCIQALLRTRTVERNFDIFPNCYFTTPISDILLNVMEDSIGNLMVLNRSRGTRFGYEDSLASVSS